MFFFFKQKTAYEMRISDWSSDVCSSDLPAHAERHIANAMEGANRASALTRRLLAFARSEPLLPESLDPDTLVHGMIELIDRTIGDQIRVETVAGSRGWKIWVDRHQLENAMQTEERRVGTEGVSTL